LNTILKLLLNDLRRDWKRPWAMLLLAMMPLCLSVLIAAIFGGNGGAGPMPTVNVAILDQDKDLLTGVLRSLPTQGDAARNLRLHFVDSREDGWRLIEKDQVSALVVLPTNMTVKLLQGRTNTIELYENPAQQVLPKVVRQGVSLLAVGLSAASETLREPLQDMRDLMRSNDLPAAPTVGAVASSSVEKLGKLRGYLFPPLIKFETVPAADFQPLSTNALPAASNSVSQAFSLHPGGIVANSPTFQVRPYPGGIADNSPTFQVRPYPGGMVDNSPTFQRWGVASEDTRVPKGRLKQARQSAIPPGLILPRTQVPNVETLGYCQVSLWDDDLGRPPGYCLNPNPGRVRPECPRSATPL
jgi:ABC-2 family transporter protein